MGEDSLGLLYRKAILVLSGEHNPPAIMVLTALQLCAIMLYIRYLISVWAGSLINKISITDQVYALLRDRIVRRVLAPGDRVEMDALVRELGISRTPIKDALTRLASEGLISVHPRRGTFVTRPSAKEFLELLDIRLGLELWGARKGIEKFTEADLQRLKGLHEGMVASVAQFDESQYERYLSFVELNQGFHGTIVRSSGNEKLFETYRSIDPAAQIQRVIFPLPRETLDRSNQEHALILEACRKRDWSSVEQAITTHVETIKQDVLQGLGSLSEKDRHEKGGTPEREVMTIALS